MQTLVFENAWNKTISERDRERVRQSFTNVTLEDHVAIQFTPLWQAMNHKGELLVTTLIHNCSTDDVTLQDESLSVKHGHSLIVTHSFTIPFVVHAKTSMPWTFIFPVHVLPERTWINENIELTLTQTGNG